MAVIHSIYRESGEVRINTETCRGCGMCVQICPAELLVMESGNVCVQDDNSFGCIACGHCMMVCPEGAITVRGRGVTPDDLMPLPESKMKAGAEELAALMQSRRSVRRFTNQEVEPAVIERIIEMAATGPMGIPPWDVGCSIIRGREQVQRVAKKVVKGYKGFLKVVKPGLLRLMRPFIGKAKYEFFVNFVIPLAETYVGGHGEGRDLLFYGAPVVLIFHHSPYAESTDATIACTYAMLAAESLGLGSTIIGGATPILQRNKKLCRNLGIPVGNTPSIAMILGYPATKFRRTIRRRFTSVVEATLFDNRS